MTDIHIERTHLGEADRHIATSPHRHIATGKTLIARIEALINLITLMAALERFVMFDEWYGD